MKMKFSVIITEQNCEQYLYKCIDSVANQTYRDFEVIIVDDASLKRKYDLEDHYHRIPIKYIYLETSRGPGGARNVGLQYANGDYICFLDSDDWWDLHYLELTNEYLSKTDADIAMVSLLREYDIPTSQPVYKCEYDRSFILTGEMAFKIMTYQYEMGIKVIPAATNKIYKRCFLLANNLKFTDNMLFEDLPYNFKAMRVAKKVIAVPNAVYHHYKRQGSIVQSFRQKNLDDMILAFQQIRQELKKDGVYEQYRNNYYHFFEHFYNLIVRQIFEFVPEEKRKKELLQISLHKLKDIIIPEEFIDYMSAEELRRHIQPHIIDTRIN